MQVTCANHQLCSSQHLCLQILYVVHVLPQLSILLAAYGYGKSMECYEFCQTVVFFGVVGGIPR